MIKTDGLYPGTSKRGRPQIFVYADDLGQSTGLREVLDEIVQSSGRQRRSSVQSLHLFCNRDGDPYTVEGFQANWQRRMNAYVSEMKAERFWEHDIRAAAGTAADEAIQAARADAQSLLGHSQEGTTRRYLRGRAPLKVLPAPRPKTKT